LILLVRKHQKSRILQLVLVQHGCELVGGGLETFDIGRINHEDDSRCVGVVAPPIRPDACLSTQIPDVEIELPVCDRLDIESDRWYGRYDLANLYSV